MNVKHIQSSLKSILDLPVPTIQAMRIIIQFKAVRFPSIIVIYAYSFKNPLQNAGPIRTTIDPFANLKKNIYNIFKFMTEEESHKKAENCKKIQVRLIHNVPALNCNKILLGDSKNDRNILTLESQRLIT